MHSSPHRRLCMGCFLGVITLLYAMPCVIFYSNIILLMNTDRLSSARNIPVLLKSNLYYNSVYLLYKKNVLALEYIRMATWSHICSNVDIPQNTTPWTWFDASFDEHLTSRSLSDLLKTWTHWWMMTHWLTPCHTVTPLSTRVQIISWITDNLSTKS